MESIATVKYELGTSRTDRERNRIIEACPPAFSSDPESVYSTPQFPDLLSAVLIIEFSLT